MLCSDKTLRGAFLIPRFMMASAGHEVLWPWQLQLNDCHRATLCLLPPHCPKAPLCCRHTKTESHVACYRHTATEPQFTCCRHSSKSHTLRAATSLPRSYTLLVVATLPQSYTLHAVSLQRATLLVPSHGLAVGVCWVGVCLMCSSMRVL